MREPPSPALIRLRPAQPADLSAINEIYNHYVLTCTCTYQESPETIESRRRWFEAQQEDGLPVLVAEIEGQIVGWGALVRFRPRSAYRFTVEDSLYVHPQWHGRGVGSALLGELIRLAGEGGHRTIVAGIDAEQADSIRLHQRYGFIEVGRLREVGYKFGRWLDVVYMQRMVVAPVVRPGTAG